jgi:hypothetical protein
MQLRAMIAIPLQHIRERAAERPPGYYERVVSLGTIVGDTLMLPADAYQSLLAEYATDLAKANSLRCPSCGE